MTNTAGIERTVRHRPWPLPSGPWFMFQSWRHLLFAHWPIARRTLRPLVPPQLEIDEFDGTAWVSLTPFLLSELRLRYLPPVPYLSEFPEMNFRTYVRVGERPGIFFFTLDAASYTAVLATRLVYGLPYRHADMDIEITKSGVSYRSRRHDGSAELVARYSATGTAFLPQPDTLEHFLTERYALYVVRLPGVTWRGDIHHKPWRIQPADADLLRNTVPQAHGLAVADHRPVLHFAARQDTLAWLPKLVAAA